MIFVEPTINQDFHEDLPRLVRNYLRGIPYHIFHYQFSWIKAEIKRMIAEIQPDVIQIDHLNMAQYLPARKTALWIYEEHNLESLLLWSRFIKQAHWKTKLFLFWEAILITSYEFRTLLKFDTIITISKRDRNLLKKIHRHKNIFYYSLPVNIKAYADRTRSNQKNILFIGDLTWHPNYQAILWFVKKVWPQIQQNHPTSKLELVGKYDQALQLLLKKKGVKFYGHQTDLNLYLKRTTVFILPFLVGEGVRIKVLTALSAGIPLVATPVGIKGLELVAGQHYLQAQSPGEFAKKVELIFQNQTLSQHLVHNGLNYLKENHSIINNQRFLRQYQKAIQESQ